MVELKRDELHASVCDPVAASMNFLNEVASRYPDAIPLAAGRPYDGFYEAEDVHRYLAVYLSYLRSQGLGPHEVRRQLLHSIELLRTSVERGKKGEIIGTVKMARPFEGKATVKLTQLPRGVKMLEPAPAIGAKDKEVVFHIEADADALAGLYKGITCEVAFTEAGQTVHSTTGSGMLRVDLARAGL